MSKQDGVNEHGKWIEAKEISPCEQCGSFISESGALLLVATCASDSQGSLT